MPAKAKVCNPFIFDHINQGTVLFFHRLAEDTQANFAKFADTIL